MKRMPFNFTIFRLILALFANFYLEHHAWASLLILPNYSTNSQVPNAAEGMFLWGRLPESTPVDELVRRARDKSILLAKGALFSPSQSCSQWMRFNAAHSADAPLVRFLTEEVRSAA